MILTASAWEYERPDIDTDINDRTEKAQTTLEPPLTIRPFPVLRTLQVTGSSECKHLLATASISFR